MSALRALGIVVAAVAVLAAPALADDPPEIDHQPVPCTVPDEPFTLCAAVFDDAMVAKTRLYFRPEDEKYYSYVEMAFGGLNYCATLPAPRGGKLEIVEYYIQAIDDGYNAKRTSTFQVSVQSPEICGFAPTERDPDKAGAITVYGTHRKQGDKLHKKFSDDGVTFVPFGR